MSDTRDQLDERGHARLGAVLADEEVADLATSFDDDARYRSRISMGRYRYGEGDYAYFGYPLPPPVQRLREQLYSPLAEIANEWARTPEAGRTGPRRSTACWLAAGATARPARRR